MKLRNVFSFAVIFFAGIAFAVAEEPADENMRRETTYLFGRSVVTEGTKIYTPSFVYSTAENNGDDTTQFERSGFTGNESGRDDYSAGYRNDGINKKRNEAESADRQEQEPEFSEEDEPEKDETAAPETSSTSDGNETLHIYEFSVPFDDRVTETIGFTGGDGVDNPLVFAEVIPKLPDNSQLSDDGSYLFLSFEKNAFTNDENAAKILTGDSYDDEGEEESVFDIISKSFTIPFALLSIVVCGGLILVMFTSTGKKTNV